MKSQRAFSIFLIYCVVIVFVLVKSTQSEDDLYRVLGVSHSASSREIRSAYKRLAKQWHPDKNKVPEAKEKFIQINRAYEVLSDDDKRHTYDTTGEVGDSPRPRAPPHGNGYTVFTTGNGFHFRFFTGGSAHRGDSITTDAFFNNVLLNSNHKPYLINFYTEFCMQCGHVEQMWNDMRKEMVALGVGLGSVHANHHPRITNYCGVNQVPTVVGVVSGRVIHFHGDLRGIGTMEEFLNNILPQRVVLLISDINMVDSFLSEVIRRNRPRAVLFSPHQSPSYRYKLAAFAHQDVADCAFVSTHKRWLNERLLAKFKVRAGAKDLVVFTEENSSLHLESSHLKGAMLKSAIGGLKLRLPRLSSQEMLNRVCPTDGGIRICVVMLIKDSTGYNDTVTRSLRGISESRLTDERFSFAYLDETKQEEFVKAFGALPSELRNCDDGGWARPVVVFKRISSQQIRFDWYDQFCGAAGDVETLWSYLTTLGHHQLRKTTFLPHLLDEEAPGWFGRQWNRLTKAYYDLLDFISVFDPQIIMSLGVLFVGTMFVCLLGLITGGPLEEERKRSTQSRHSSTQRQRRQRTPPHQGSPQRRRAPVYYLDGQTYSQLVQCAPKGQLTVVLFLNTHDPSRSQPLAQHFWRIMERYASPHLRICFLCYKAFPRVLGNILSQCEAMSEREKNVRVEAMLSGTCATVVAIIGSKKQLSIFPDKLHDNRHQNGTVAERGGSGGVNNVGSGKNHGKSVGEVLGSSLGFEDDPEKGDDDDNRHDCDTEQPQKHQTLSSSGSDQSDRSNHSEHIRNGRVSTSDSDDTTTTTSDSSRRENGASLGGDTRLEQMKHLEMWMEMFCDGSLKRFRVKDWPEWQSTISTSH